MNYCVNKINYELGCLKVLNNPAWEYRSLFITYNFCNFCQNFVGTRANKVEPALEKTTRFPAKAWRRDSVKAIKLLSYREDEENRSQLFPHREVYRFYIRERSLLSDQLVSQPHLSLHILDFLDFKNDTISLQMRNGGDLGFFTAKCDWNICPCAVKGPARVHFRPSLTGTEGDMSNSRW